ncbi:hypothetical protein OPAG_07992 [Rhodococcus opacus PD630]|nr:hypothetical protein Pd630_LPD00203 [Rhodococcus opacus PD630]EHI47542.1 hypothetical protein OPAG_07992 [Rhodococcus opacus PD630]KXX62250.1 hypothetical protein AZG88_30245 [Rhodococcus sp. LB1]
MDIRQRSDSTIGIARRVFDSCVALVSAAAAAPVAFALAEGMAMSRIARVGLEADESSSDENLHDLGTVIELI